MESNHIKKLKAQRDDMVAADIQELIKAIESDTCVHCKADLRPMQWWGSRIGLFEPKLRYKPYAYSVGGCFPVGPWCCDKYWDDWILFIELINIKKIAKTQLSSAYWNKDVLDLLFA